MMDSSVDIKEMNKNVEEGEGESGISQNNEQSYMEPERRFIDGKWFCQDGNGDFLIYEGDKWIAADNVEGNLKQKWDDAGAASIAGTSSNPYRCVVDGITMEWNEISQQWLPVVEVNEDFLAQYHCNYGINYDFGEKEETNTAKSDQKVEESKATRKQKSHDKKEEQGWIELEEEKNTSVYVSNLPLNITEEEFTELMSKCGVIQRDARTNKRKIKLYKNDDGTWKGDGRCCYIKKESVDLALAILDGWNMSGKIISVEKAKFQMKGEFDPSKKKKKLTAAQKKRFIESQERIFEWKPEKPRNYRPVSDCTIVMKKMFTLEQMMKNASLILDLEEEVRKVCERFGIVKKVIVHDNNPEGVVSVKFESVEHSDAAVRSLNGRVVDGRQISVSLWDGKTKYTIAETEEQRAERLKQWQNYISEDAD